MNLKQVLCSAVTIGFAALSGVGVSLAFVFGPANAQQAAVAIDNDDIGGVVRGPAGPEAGVWVIAETTELPTKFAKMVVTDDQGRYVIPDLPAMRTTRSGCAATGWWIRPRCARSRASSSILRRCRRRTRQQRRTIIRRSTGTR